MQNNAKYIATIAISIAIGAAGAGFSFWLGQRVGNGAITNRIVQPQKPVDEISAPVHLDKWVIVGTVTSVDGNVVSISNPGKSTNATEKDIRKVTVTAKTELLGQTKLSNIKVGDIATVFTAEDPEIKKEFVAIKIQVSPKPTLAPSSAYSPPPAPAAK